MRFLALVTVAVTVVVAAATGTALASHQRGEGSPWDFAVGSYTTTDRFREASFSAHETRNGTRGQINVRAGLIAEIGHFHGEVVCLSVNGNRATLLAFVGPFEFEGTVFDGYIAIVAQDNGEPNDTTPDLASFVSLLLPPGTPQTEELCDLIPFGPTHPVESGNITIHDATP
jgi:hypothetical protein